MSEKAVSIGFYFVASGVFTTLGMPLPIEGSEKLTRYVTDELEGIVGGRFVFESDPIAAAGLMIEHIDKKRAALKLKEAVHS
jgi:carbon-monoxide dehydrogenase catalytic subunit